MQKDGLNHADTNTPKLKLLYYIFKARYQYEVDGEVYNSDRVSFLSKYISKEKYSDIKNKYAAGSTTDVFYNPDTPSESVLITGVSKYNKNPFSLYGIVMLCFGIFGITRMSLLSLKID